MTMRFYFASQMFPFDIFASQHLGMGERRGDPDWSPRTTIWIPNLRSTATHGSANRLVNLKTLYICYSLLIKLSTNHSVSASALMLNTFAQTHHTPWHLMWREHSTGIERACFTISNNKLASDHRTRVHLPCHGQRCACGPLV